MNSNTLTYATLQEMIDRLPPKPKLREIVITRLVPPGDGWKFTIKDGDVQGVMKVDTEHILVHPDTWRNWERVIDFHERGAVGFGTLWGLPVIADESRAREIISKALAPLTSGFSLWSTP